MIKAEMTSRQRIDAALNHHPTDRVPIDFGASRVTGIAAIAYAKLLRHLGIKETLRLYDIKQQLAVASPEMVDRLGGDVLPIHRLGPTTGMPFLAIDRWKDGRLTDGTPCLVPEAYEPVFLPDGTIEILHEGAVFARRSPFSLYFDVCRAPLRDAQTIADIEAWKFSDDWSAREEQFVREQISVATKTGKALFGSIPLLNGSFFEIGATLFGYETFMMNLVLRREVIEAWLDRLLAHDLEILEPFLRIAGPHLSAIQMNDDFGAQETLQVSPQMYREIFKPRQRRWIEFVKHRTAAKIFLHCDGAVEELLGDFIEIGIDILNPLQTSARGMDPRTIKTKYGRNLSFWGGGVETQSTLPFGSIDEIRDQVRSRIEILSPGGGYVFSPIHNIQADISPDKILAVFDTAKNTPPTR